MKYQRLAKAKQIQALVLSSLSAFAYAQTIPSVGNPVIIDSAPHYKGDPLDANVKIDKVLVIQGKPPAGWTPKFEFQVNVRENLPPAPQGCKWQAPVYTPSTGTTNVASGQVGVVQVKNVLVCEDKWCADAKPLSVNLGQAANWKIPGTNTPRATVAPVVGWATPTSAPEKALGQWAGLSASGASGSPAYDSEIRFCLCGNSKADARIDHLRGDNHAEVYFDNTATMVGTTAVVGQDPKSFSPYRTGVNGYNTLANTSSSPSTHTLVTRVTDQGGSTGFTMNGFLNVNKGYLGACKAAD